MAQILYVRKAEGNTYSLQQVVDTFLTTDDLESIKAVVERAEDRVYVSWASVDVRDRDGEKIPIDDVIRDQDVLLRRNGPITDEHTNAVVGQTLAYKVLQHPETGKVGVLHLNRIFADNDMDNIVWQETQEGKRTGSSVGGYSLRSAFEKDADTGMMTRIREDFHQYETANVRRPSNPWALNEAVSIVAKSASVQKPFAGYKDFDACVAANKDKEDPKEYCAAIMRQTEKGESVINNLSQETSISTIKTLGGEQMDEDFVKKVDQYGQDISELKKGVDSLTATIGALTKAMEDKKPPEEPDMPKDEEKKVSKEDAASDIEGEKGKDMPKSPTPDESNDADVMKQEIKKHSEILASIQKDLAAVAKTSAARPAAEPNVEKVTKAQQEARELPMKLALGQVKKTWTEVNLMDRERVDSMMKAGYPLL